MEVVKKMRKFVFLDEDDEIGLYLMKINQIVARMVKVKK